MHPVLSERITKCLLGPDIDLSSVDSIKRHPRGAVVVTLKWLLEISGLHLPSKFRREKDMITHVGAEPEQKSEANAWGLTNSKSLDHPGVAQNNSSVGGLSVDSDVGNLLHPGRKNVRNSQSASLVSKPVLKKPLKRSRK